MSQINEFANSALIFSALALPDRDYHGEGRAIVWFTLGLNNFAQ